MSDDDRSALYAAEIAAFDGTELEASTSVERLGALVALVCTGGWWPGPPVEVRSARLDAMSSATRCGSAGTTLSIARGQATVATAAHELAHALAGVDHGHDALFRAAYLDVVATITNLDPVGRRGSLHLDQLADAFERFGLAVAPRAWPAPPSPAGPIAL